jgi:hypothetical protein
MVNAGGGFTVIVIAWLADSPAASVSSNVTELLPAGPVGVPLIVPPLLKLSPAGSVPEVMVHLYGLVPPDSLKVAL